MGANAVPKQPHNDHLKPGTFANQNDLPRVPLAGLQETCERFLAWCRPLLTEAELSETRRAVETFARTGGPGEALQQELERYDKRPDVHSWLDDFWPQRYLGRRDPIALNANFFFLFPDDAALAGADTQIARATWLISSALHYKHLLDTETLPVATMRGMPLCMEETKYLFSATRIPAHGRDGVRKPYSQEQPGPSKARHILVFHKGHIFTLDVIGPEGAPHTPEEIADALWAIAAASDQAVSGMSVGHLTTMPRAAWADHRAQLLGDSHNASLIDRIETALFTIVLEDVAPKTDLEACDHLLHGNSANRHFDKAVSLIVFGNGRAGINIEHCGLDGTAVLDFVDALHAADVQSHAAAALARAQGAPKFAKLDFNLSPAQKSAIAKAGEDFTALARNAASRTFCFDDFGTQRIKAYKVSPDAFFQLAMQLAHKRTKGLIGATYESIATRQFDHGRTEAMRVVTPEILSFVESMEDSSAGAAERIAAFRAVADAHVRRAKECQAGEAPEQHLWELLMIHGRRGEQLGIHADQPAAEGKAKSGLFGLLSKTSGAKANASQETVPFALYSSPGWVKMRSDYLSTSSAPSLNALYFGFGSTAPQCIGVGYVLRPDAIHCYLCTPASQIAARDAFADNLAAALRELAELLDGQS